MRTSKFYNFLLFFILLLIVGSACTEQPHVDVKKSTLDDFFGTDSLALFRGHQMGDTAQNIRQSEDLSPIVDTDSLLQYHYFYNLESDSTDIDLYYTIDSYGLFEIQADLHPKSEGGAENIMAKITEILNERYGDYKEAGIVRRWTTNNKSNELIEITLSNESEDYGSPFVSLNFLEPLPNEI